MGTPLIGFSQSGEVTVTREHLGERLLQVVLAAAARACTDSFGDISHCSLNCWLLASSCPQASPRNTEPAACDCERVSDSKIPGPKSLPKSISFGPGCSSLSLIITCRITLPKLWKRAHFGRAGF